MKTLFNLLFITILCSCSVAKNTETIEVELVDKTEEKDSIVSPKPAVLNGKVITPSTNNSSIGEPKQKKENQ